MINKIFNLFANRIKKFKNKHKDQSCYIFGDGISIKWFDLSVFPKKITFTLNQFLFHPQSSVLNPTYHILIQPYFFYPYRKVPVNFKSKWWRNKVKDKHLDIFKKFKNIEYFVSLSNYPIIRDKNINYLYKTINDLNYDFLYECNLNKIDIFEGVFKASISLAIYMGFKEIVLVGCDYTHINSRTHHWYEKGAGTIKLKQNYQKKFIKIASKYIKIITITLDGGGSIIKGIPYKEFTGQAPFFKENSEILDRKTLTLLDTYPNYKVF